MYHRREGEKEREEEKWLNTQEGRRERERERKCTGEKKEKL